ncbi:MAG TPA: hypothetical protein VN822_12395 [Candidatus Acidoferrales bacterium]|nr:hypothetical protein [Candidatus Acidoferrales bacterium]
MSSRPIDARVAAVFLTCGLSLSVAGCARKSVHAAAPAEAAPISAEARPITTAPDTDASPPSETAAAPPALPVAVAPPPPPVVAPPAKIPAPRRSAAEPAPAESSSEPPHPPAPQIFPQLSPGDQANYERKTGEDVSVVEKNLQETSGKQLSAAQQDLVAKIRSFLSQSLDASKGGDWARAQNLAQKARLLSVELINSF